MCLPSIHHTPLSVYGVLGSVHFGDGRWETSSRRMRAMTYRTSLQASITLRFMAPRATVYRIESSHAHTRSLSPYFIKYNNSGSVRGSTMQIKSTELLYVEKWAERVIAAKIPHKKCTCRVRVTLCLNVQAEGSSTRRRDTVVVQLTVLGFQLGCPA